MKQYVISLFLAAALLLSSGNALAEREILYPASLSGKLQKVVENIQNQPEVPYSDLSAETEYFVRIAPREYVLTKDNKIKESAIIGTKPFVFITTPEGIYGKSLLNIYLDIGYEAEDIIQWQRDKEMTAVVFRYPKEIVFSDVKNGQLSKDWDKKIYSPTWDNMFSIFDKLAENALVEPDKKGEFAPEKIFFRSNELKNFVSGFPEAGKERIKRTGYATLKEAGGADWVYRDLLEKKLSLFEHFRGNGRTLNEIKDPDGFKKESGLLEFVGPNMKLRELPELAVIYLGKLIVEDTIKMNQ